ncbi:hypothetical protein LWI29_032842 [Acer saccharum]|uniref:non-specific serine/threonine protein kinase n=1 Tax=Acer saccharum TaxID=4024 RepID=A0AA39VM37_ACESA|nr:hypothetical protein LWI29_032842 [Acer saccharum]
MANTPSPQNSPSNNSTESPPGSPPPSSPPPASPPQSSSPPPQSPPPSSPPPESPPPSSPPQQSPPPSSPPPSQSPPPTSSPPPSGSNSSPPPSQNTSPSPPPPLASNTKNNSPPAPSTTPNNNNNNNNNSPNGSDSPSVFKAPPPPPRTPATAAALRPPGASSNRNSPPSNSSGSGSTVSIPLVAAVAVVAGIVLVAFLLLFLLCRKKKKHTQMDQMQYYRDHNHSNPGGGQQQQRPNWQNTTEMMNNLPPPPGGWAAPPPPPPPPAIANTSSASFSDSTQGLYTVLPPPTPPSMALGFTTQGNFTYEELSVATNGFSEANLLGQGGFGFVHKGVLPNGKEVAVKSLKVGSGQGDREFKAEVEIISRVHHRYLVSLVGYCIAGDKRLLVYEFLPNNNLAFHLHGKGRPPMDFPSRLKIALGSAKGLAYLHEDCHPRIIHRDIKSSNILLDFIFEAKVADFGLAKLTSDNYSTHVSTRVMGTFGYMAPEYASSGKLTEKSDVFSFGVMLLELISGRLPIDPTGTMEDSLVDWARPLCLRALEDGNYDEIADPFLEKNYPVHEMARMVACASASIRHSARRRPRMSQIVRALEGDVSLEDLNDGAKLASNNSLFGGSSASGGASSNTSEHDHGLYADDMKRYTKAALNNAPYISSEFGATSEYGLNPSTSSSESGSRNDSPKARPIPK